MRLVPGYALTAWLLVVARTSAVTLAGSFDDGCAADEFTATDDHEEGEPNGAVLRIERGDGVTRLHLAELRQRSATGRDLLERIERLQSTVLIVSVYPLLVKTTRLYGRGRFWVTGEQLRGYLLYQTESLGNDRPLCIIVHELAHSVEVAGIDRRNGTEGIREFVLSRATGDDPLDWRGSETEFPRLKAGDASCVAGAAWPASRREWVGSAGYCERRRATRGRAGANVRRRVGGETATADVHVERAPLALSIAAILLHKPHRMGALWPRLPSVTSP